MPAASSFEEAAALCDGGLNVLWLLRLADLRKGQRVLALRRGRGHRHRRGPAGKEELGADVTGVCSTKSLELVRSLGANRVIDRTQEDFTKNGETYDVIFDAVGKHSFGRCKGSRLGGAYLATDGFRNVSCRS